MEHFILMADIKESRKKDSKFLMDRFKSLTKELNKKNKKNLLSPLTITLGDEFQCVINNINNSTHLIFDIEELIIKQEYNFKLRYVLHYGEIDTSVNSKIAYEMLGRGLSEAREKLNNIKKSDSRFVIELGNKRQNELFNNLFMVYQNFIDEWREKDRPLVKAFIDHKDYKEVSAIVNLNPSSAWRREKSLRIKQYFAIKDVISLLSK